MKKYSILFFVVFLLFACKKDIAPVNNTGTEMASASKPDAPGNLQTRILNNHQESIMTSLQPGIYLVRHQGITKKLVIH